MAAAICCLCFGISARAQTFSETVEIRNLYKPKLSDAEKLEVKPVAESAEAKPLTVTINEEPVLFKQQPYKVKLKALQVGKPKVEELYRMHASASIGNYADIRGELLFSSGRSKESSYSTFAKWHSGNGPVKPSAFTDLSLGGAGKYAFKNNLQGTGEASYTHQTLHWYGNRPEGDETPRDSLKQRFSLPHLGVGLQKLATEEQAWNFGGRLSYTGISDIEGTAENNFMGEIEGGSRLGDGDAGLRFAFELMPIKFAGDSSLGRSIIRFEPLYRFNYQQFQLKAGFSTASESNTGEDLKFHVYPILRAQTGLLDGKITAFAGISGGLKANTFKSLTDENPFLVSVPRLKNQNEKIKFETGLQAAIGSYMTAGASLGLSRVANLPFYVNDSLDTNRFAVYYDGDGTNLTVFKLFAAYSYNQIADFSGELKYTAFNLDTLRGAYHRAPLEARLNALYQIGERISLGGTLIFWGERDALKIETGEIMKLKPIADINFRLGYQFTTNKNLNAFLEFGNVLSVQYNRWLDYPARGFQVRGGASINLFAGK